MQLRKHLEYIKFYLSRITIKEKIKVVFSSAVGFRRKGYLSRGLRKQLVVCAGNLWPLYGPHITQHIRRLFINSICCLGLKCFVLGSSSGINEIIIKCGHAIFIGVMSLFVELVSVERIAKQLIELWNVEVGRLDACSLTSFSTSNDVTAKIVEFTKIVN